MDKKFNLYKEKERKKKIASLALPVAVWGDTSSSNINVLQGTGADFYDGPTTVTVNSMIRSISKIDDYKMVSNAANNLGWIRQQGKKPIQKHSEFRSTSSFRYISLHVVCAPCAVPLQYIL